MAARTRKLTLSDEWKAKIQVTQLINRLEACAMGEVKLDAQQIKSIEIILRKLVPDLKSVDMIVGGDAENPLSIDITNKALSMLTTEQLEALRAENNEG